MSDRNSAELFCLIFELLAENPTDEHKQMARKIYDKSSQYDFSNSQMEADDACLKLGIARKGVNPKYPEDGEVILWPSDEGYDDAADQTTGAVN